MEDWPLETNSAVKTLRENGFMEISVYNFGKQINAADVNGIIQTFYPTTGTILLHSCNERGNKMMTLRDETVESFIDFISNTDRITQLFQ